MELETANQPIRWKERIGIFFKTATSSIGDVFASFFDFKEGDSFWVKSGKFLDLVIRRGIYFAMDYGLVLLSVALVVAMKSAGIPFSWIFVAMWVFDFVAAGAFVVSYEKTGKDLSLGVDLRRAVDTVRGKSRYAGYVALGIVLIQAVVWTGPEQIVIFFRKEIGTIPRVVLVLLLLTAAQAIIYSALYALGYDLVGAVL